MFKTRQGRAAFGAIAFSAVLDVVIAFVLSLWLSSGSDQWFTFFATLAVLWVAPIVLVLKTTLYKALFFLLAKNSTRNALVQEFRKFQLPLLSGTGFNDPADLYFSEVAQDDDLPKPARIFAAQSLGQFALLPRYSMADTLITHVNVDAALAIYFDQLRRDGVKPHSANG